MQRVLQEIQVLREQREQPELQGYRHRIEDICRVRAHILDEKTEGLLARLSRPASAPDIQVQQVRLRE